MLNYQRVFLAIFKFAITPRVLHLDGELQLPQMSFRALLRGVAHVAGPGRQQPLHRGFIGLAATVSMETEKLYPICSI